MCSWLSLIGRGLNQDGLGKKNGWNSICGFEGTCYLMICASGSVGGVRPCQGRGRGFESRLALSMKRKPLVMKAFAFFWFPREGLQETMRFSFTWKEISFSKPVLGTDYGGRSETFVSGWDSGIYGRLWWFCKRRESGKFRRNRSLWLFLSEGNSSRFISDLSGGYRSQKL